MCYRVDNVKASLRFQLFHRAVLESHWKGIRHSSYFLPKKDPLELEKIKKAEIVSKPDIV